LIENSILHGIQNLENGGIIEIKIKNYKTEKISIEIINPVNNKTVFNNNNNNNISLKNIKERLKIYFGGDIKFNISEIDNKFRVYVIIPQKIH
jgi:two-component system sensor histidine kinase AlgZ